MLSLQKVQNFQRQAYRVFTAALVTSVIAVLVLARVAAFAIWR